MGCSEALGTPEVLGLYEAYATLETLRAARADRARPGSWTYANGDVAKVAAALVSGRGDALGAAFADPTALSRMITCAQAYQRYNWWFVVCTFFLTYIGIKMFAIPAVFPLGILGGAVLAVYLVRYYREHYTRAGWLRSGQEASHRLHRA